MGYIDLMIGRTPGRKIAQLAARASKGFNSVADDLPRLESLGKSLPHDPLFGAPHARTSARRAFANASDEFLDASNTARDFAYGRNSNSLSWVISSATDAQTSARNLGHKYSQLPERMMDNVSRAQRRADSAVDYMERARYSDPQIQKRFAADASHDLREGHLSMEDARYGLSRMLAPFNEHDSLRLSAESRTSSAASRASAAAKVDDVSDSVKALTSESARLAGEAKSAMLGHDPKMPTSSLAAQLNAVQAQLDSTRSAALLEPKPKNFGLKVAAARIGTLGVVGGAAGGTYYLVTRD